MLGIHQPAKDYLEAINIVKQLGLTHIQFFYDFKKNKHVDTLKIKNSLNKNNLTAYVHGSFAILLGRESHQYNYSNILLMKTLEFGSKIGAKGIVIHPGHYGKQTEQVVLHNFKSNLQFINSFLVSSQLDLLIETPSGQGQEFLMDLNKLILFLQKVNLPNVKMCVDTCHLFAVGFDFNNEEIIKLIFNKLQESKLVKLIHFNNSVKSVGSYRDMHASLKYGEIKDMKLIFKYFSKLNVPFILETNVSKWEEDAKLIQTY